MTHVTADQVDSDLQTFKTQVPTNEDLILTYSHHFDAKYAASNGGFTRVAFVAPFDMTIKSVNCSGSHGNVPADDVNYWEVRVVHVVDGIGTTMAQMTTQATGAEANGPMDNYQDWNFDGATWDHRDVAAGDIVRINHSPVGNPQEFPAEWVMTFRYQRL